MLSDKKPRVPCESAGRTLADTTLVYQSPNPLQLQAFGPGIARSETGRLIGTFDLGGPEVERLPGSKTLPGANGAAVLGKILTSDDGGKHWQHRTDFPFYHARPFYAGNILYVIGHVRDLMIMRSLDDGLTWSQPVPLTEGESWTAAPTNVWHNGHTLCLVMERKVYSDVIGWNVNGLAPILLKADPNSDLTQRSSWSFASPLSFRDAFPNPSFEDFGIPFFETRPGKGVTIAPGRMMDPLGWLESNVIQIQDPHHYWYDPNGKTFHVFSRFHSGGTGYAALLKVVEQPDGSLVTGFEQAPSGRRLAFLPFPGGQMKFHLLYDAQQAYYWLLGTQATDSLTRAEALPADRYNLPNNERNRLVLHFSKNMVDWCFAGVVAIGETPGESRHYASMEIDGEDLAILSRSASPAAKSAHDTDLITFHRVRDFRSLVY